MKETLQERELILRAVTNPSFRRSLEENPAAVLGVKELTAENKQEIQHILSAVRNINAQVAVSADLMLCEEPPRLPFSGGT